MAVSRSKKPPRDIDEELKRLYKQYYAQVEEFKRFVDKLAKKYGTK